MMRLYPSVTIGPSCRLWGPSSSPFTLYLSTKVCLPCETQQTFHCTTAVSFRAFLSSASEKYMLCHCTATLLLIFSFFSNVISPPWYFMTVLFLADCLPGPLIIFSSCNKIKLTHSVWTCKLMNSNDFKGTASELLALASFHLASGCLVTILKVSLKENRFIEQQFY